MKLQEALPEFNEDLQNDSMGGQIILRRHGEMPLEVLDQSKLFSCSKGAMVQRRNGAMEQRSYGLKELWHSG